MSFIITIDGPAGSGKSTAARRLAARLEIAYLDTGAMYRAVTHGVMQAAIDPYDRPAVERLLKLIDLRIDCGPTHTRVSLNGHDVSEVIRQPNVNAQASIVAQIPAVREYLIRMQRDIAISLKRLVTEGRDQGSSVFPKANFKYVLTASAEKRAERRYHELAAEGIDEPFQKVLDNLIFRDRNDSHRWSALVNDPEVTVIDTTTLTMNEVIDVMARPIEPLLKAADQPGLFDT